MPNQVPLGAFEIPQGSSFRRKFLYAVLAKESRAGIVGLLNDLRWKSLGNSHQADGVGISIHAAGSSCDPTSDFSNILCYGHGARETGERRITSETTLILRIG